MRMPNATYTKEGFVSATVGGIISLGVGVVVVTLMLIFGGTLGGQVYQTSEADIDTISGTVTHETVGTANATGYLSDSLAVTPVYAGSETIYCNSTALYDAAANYTLNDATGALVVDSSTYCAGAAVNASYTWGDPSIEGYIKESILGAFKGQKQVGTQMPTLVLAVIVIMIMGLVMGMGGMGGSHGGGYYGGAL